MSAPIAAHDPTDPAAILSPDVPPLPENATAAEKEAHWFKYVYQGDKVPQFTFRAVLMGGVIGSLMSISNLYTTLKLGWAFGVAITACVISYVIWNAIRAVSGNRVSQMSILENNCMQSTASAAGYSTGSTIATAFGALMMLEGGKHSPWLVVGSFTFFTACLGVFLAIPMKRQMINVEQLKFPSGTAAAVTLKSLYSTGSEAVKKAYSLVIAIGIGSVVALLRTYGTLTDVLKDVKHLPKWLQTTQENLHIPDAYEIPSQLAGVNQFNMRGFPFGPSLPSTGLPFHRMTLDGLSFEPSLLLIGAGTITGLRVSLSMLLGSALVYFVFGPYLIQMDNAHAGVAGYVMSIPLNGSGDVFKITRWSLWGGTSIMVFSSLTSVALQWKTIARSFRSVKGGTASSTDVAMAGVEVPTSWLIGGLIPITIGLIAVQYFAFHISPWLGLIAVAMSFVLALVACRATGETDTTPIGAMGKVMQLTFAVLSPHNVQHNLMSAGIAANGASSSADLLTDLKSGYLLGANPRKQFLAQFVGLFFGTLAVVPAWYLLVPDIKALEKFNPPATNMWKAVAEALTQGLDSVPKSAQLAIVIGAILGVLLPVLQQLFPKAARFIPSPMGLGLGWVVTFSNSFSFAIGAVITWLWEITHRKTADAYNVPIASGFIAGESLMAAFVAIACTVAGLVWGATT